MQPPADVRAGPAADRARELGAVDTITSEIEDAPRRDSRIPPTVSTAFRRAARRVREDNDRNRACDVASGDSDRALDAICDAVRRRYGRGRGAPVSSGPMALQALKQLRQAFIEEIDALRTLLQPGELCEALAAFDLVREEMDRDESERFVGALSSGDALDLVVEIAHDMRSPLTAILMLTEMVRRAPPETPDGASARQLGLVYGAAFGLNALVNDVIALAQAGDRLIDRESVPFSMSAIMDSVADILRPIAEERQIALEVTAPSVDARVGQPVAVSRVLLNLASNALKFTETGEVVIRAADLPSSKVRFEVVDTGPGMPADVMDALFEPFAKRGPACRGRRFSNTGLGLAICRKLLRDMGSELHVQSEPNRGTRFFFDLALPVADDSQLLTASAGAAFL